MTTSPFPKLSQVWRLARMSGWAFASQALAGLAHVAWADRAAMIAAGVAVAEAGYRQMFPSGKVAGQVAALLAAYRQITAAAKPVATPETPAAPAA